MPLVSLQNLGVQGKGQGVENLSRDQGAMVSTIPSYRMALFGIVAIRIGN